MTDDWIPKPPRTLTPVGAAGRDDLRGKRVLVGQPGLGWRGDLRADAPVVQGSRTYVPVLTEQEWYRAEVEQVETFAPLVPVDRVWVEVLGDSEAEDATRWKDLFTRLVSLDAPAPRQPISARVAASLTGRRVVRVSPSGEQRDLRAVTEPYQNAASDICVRICTELNWYRWGWTGQVPRSQEVPVYLLWIE
ncbi:hypothetical protein GCM10023322_67180 [Rugosimonospora acidiphila]|uniref:Uncharacterized protein n=1 Tax=Rugosimonospora acidiphila TaxID=556531 RepID=A0ABP9SL52_9ACTN